MIAFPHILNSESKAKQGHLLKVSQQMTNRVWLLPNSVSRAHVLAPDLNRLSAGCFLRPLLVLQWNLYYYHMENISIWRLQRPC